MFTRNSSFDPEFGGSGGKIKGIASDWMDLEPLDPPTPNKFDDTLIDDQYWYNQNNPSAYVDDITSKTLIPEFPTTAIPIIATCVKSFIQKDYLGLYIGIATFVCWVIYLVSHRIEKWCWKHSKWRRPILNPRNSGIKEKKSWRPLVVFRSHPYLEDRIRVAEAEVGALLD